MENDFDLWRTQRLAELSAPEGWLSLVGLVWLEPGDNTVGSDPAAQVCLPRGPARLGILRLTESAIHWHPAPECPASVTGRHAPRADGSVVLDTDKGGQPSLLRWHTLSLFVMEREGRLGARLKDSAWAERAPFAGLSYFPFDPSWRIEATWQALSPALSLAVSTMTGDIKTVAVHHRAVFLHEGTEISLLPLEDGPDGAFFVFRDGSSGKESYGGGRFLKTGAAENGLILLDFNRAFNPPCAFTPFAACPLPPPENRLPFPVTAGEQKYTG
jgi:hypothetical protein